MSINPSVIPKSARVMKDKKGFRFTCPACGKSSNLYTKRETAELIEREHDCPIR